MPVVGLITVVIEALLVFQISAWTYPVSDIAQAHVADATVVEHVALLNVRGGGRAARFRLVEDCCKRRSKSSGTAMTCVDGLVSGLAPMTTAFAESLGMRCCRRRHRHETSDLHVSTATNGRSPSECH